MKVLMCYGCSRWIIAPTLSGIECYCRKCGGMRMILATYSLKELKKRTGHKVLLEVKEA